MFMEECRMRCRLIVFLMILVLVFPICACAEEDMLFPARGEQELWGYINIRGEWVIPPQYEAAHEFGKGRYTMVSTVDGFDGIIDRQGRLTNRNFIIISVLVILSGALLLLFVPGNKPM